MENKSFSHLLFFHVAFGILCVLVFLAVPITTFEKFLSLVVIYNFALVFFARIKNDELVFRIWLFLFPLSIFQVLPDWFLSSVLKVLVFPKEGIMIGTVPLYMAGLWVIPLFLIVYPCMLLEKSKGLTFATVFSFLGGIVIFGISEMFSVYLHSWHAQNVETFFNMAYYVILPEGLLGLSAFLGYRFFATAIFGVPILRALGMNKTNRVFMRVLVAYVVSIIYLGNLAIFYLFIEG